MSKEKIIKSKRCPNVRGFDWCLGRYILVSSNLKKQLETNWPVGFQFHFKLQEHDCWAKPHRGHDPHGTHGSHGPTGPMGDKCPMGAILPMWHDGGQENTQDDMCGVRCSRNFCTYYKGPWSGGLVLSSCGWVPPVGSRA